MTDPSRPMTDPNRPQSNPPKKECGASVRFNARRAKSVGSVGSV